MAVNPRSAPVPTVPVVDLDRIARMYAGLKKMEIRLDPNPIEYGPKRFNNRIAQVRSMLTRLEQVFLQTSEDLHYFQRLISSKNALYELEKRDLMIHDQKCRVGRSQGEREALADVQLREDIETLQKLQLAAQDLESMMIVIKSKRTDLKDIQGRMRDQMKLIEHDLGMGARWGANAPPSVVSQSVDELDALLANTDIQMGIEPDDDSFEEPVEVDDSQEDPAPQGEPGSELPLDEMMETEAVVEEEEPEAVLEKTTPDPVQVSAEEAPEEPQTPEEPTNTEGEVIPEETAEGTLPEKHSEQGDVDSFLEELDTASDDGVEEVSEQEQEQGIDDLLASFSD